MYLQETLKKFSFWTKFIGYVTVISGAISAFFGLFSFVIGAIPGIITIIMGIKLINAAKNAEELIHDPNLEDGQMEELIENMKTYFKIQGILMIVALLLIPVFLILGIGGAMLFSNTMY